MHEDGSVNRVVLGQANLALQIVGRRPAFFTPSVLGCLPQRQLARVSHYTEKSGTVVLKELSTRVSGCPKARTCQLLDPQQIS